MFGSIIKAFKEGFRESAVSVGDTDDPDAPFKWGRRCGIVRNHHEVSVWVDLHPLSVGGGSAYDGSNGPLGFTTRDADLIDSFIRAARAQGEDVGGWVIEATDGVEWQRSDGAWDNGR